MDIGAIIKLLSSYDINIIIVGIVLFFTVKYVNKNINKTPCIKTQEFKDAVNTLQEVKSLLQGLVYGFTYTNIVKAGGKNVK